MSTTKSTTATKKNNNLSWKTLPEDIRLHIHSKLSLSDAFNLNLAYPQKRHSLAFRKRVSKLKEIRDAWVISEQSALPSYSNPPSLATPSARRTLAPLSFVQLCTLTLGRTHLHEFPDCISELSGLRVLDASNNHLRSVPQSLAECKALRVLNLGHNELQSFPQIVMKLPNLCTLLLHNNPIRSVPEDKQWFKLSNLYRLGLYDCKLSGCLPKHLCEWLCTVTNHGRRRSANMEHNDFRREDLEDVFANFPTLSRSIMI